jgi:hypothetical protein
MATAPKPGAARKAEAQRTALRIKLNGTTHVLHASDLGPADDRIARRETGFPVSYYFNQEKFGADSLLVLLWTARRKAGEADLLYAEVEKEFPTYADLDGVEVEEVTDEEDDSPEG